VAKGKIHGINGPVLTVIPHAGSGDFFISERVRIGERGLAGEVVSLRLHPGPGIVIVQVYEDTAGLKPGETVYGTGHPLSIRFSPGMAGHIFDGIGRQLDSVAYDKKNPGCTYPVRIPRPVRHRLPLTVPLVTGQRVIDSLFPIAKGGVAAIPGGFGTGKTMTQHQLAKWCDADFIVYIGCGERGNEMAEVLEDFSRLTDPRTGESLMARTVLIANTSDMPVAAREASIYTGLAIAEGYRDRGYHVAVMADSTSRWAEALRELSGRLDEIPAEEGYPAYLASRLSAFYERAGYVQNLNGTEGSITIVGAVSPQGADFSEPVTQNTKRFVRCFWALDRRLAYARHFPAIDWMASYSDYAADLMDAEMQTNRQRILEILYEENKILEVAKLVGTEALSKSQKTTLHTAKRIRTDFLAQNAYDPTDTYTPPEKQREMMGCFI
jgi:V/A-type H+-transporting ATPase subunit A